MSAAANDITAEGVKALYNEVIEKLIAVSVVEAPHNSLPYFNPVVKSEVPDGYTMNNKQKYKYVAYKTPRDMTDEEYLSLPGKGNLTQEVKSSRCSFVMDDDMPPVLLGHFVVCVSYTLKVFSTYGMMAKNFAMAMEAINYALDTNHVVVPHSKCIGQRLRKLQDQSVRQWIEELCNAFSGDDSQRTFQGDGQLDAESAVGIGIPSRGLTSGEEKSAEEYYRYMLAELKAHKDAKTWLLTATACEQQKTNNILLTNINSVVAGK